jgi:hypothetical protein
MSGDGPVEAPAEHLTGEAGDLLAQLAGPGAVLIGIGWATVDLDRAAPELCERLQTKAAGPAPADRLLGARARIATLVASPAGPALALVVLEPDREGPLAAFLARHGEGIAAVYARLPGGAAGSFEDDPARGSVVAGPLGPARRRAGGRNGPFLIELLGPRGL